MLGILLIDKPEGGTSHDAVNQLRRTFGTRRIGHAGTLDPLATGLLVAAVGSATRFLQYLPLEPKVYEGEIQFGQTSPTYDREGELSDPTPIPADFEDRVATAISGFKGLIQQLPPIYSAVKVAGKPLYHYARKGEDAPREPRSVFIESLEWRLDGPGRIAIRLVCSGGTYVRTLADDLGRVVGCGAHLASLRRTQAGRFHVEQAVALAEASPVHLIPLAEALPPMPMVELNETQVRAIRMGQRVGLSDPPVGRLAGLLAPDGLLVGVAQIDGTSLQPECVLPLEAVHG